MDIKFDVAVTNHRFTLKCIPKTDGSQKISHLKVTVFPNQFINETRDSFGNACIVGYAPLAHKNFYVDVSGYAQTGVFGECERVQAHKVGFYKYPTKITASGKVIKEYFSAFNFENDSTNKEKAILMMNKLHGDFAYQKGATGVETTAEVAASGMCGVCQDYSHILISLCQLAKIPARYVVGLLVGEGYSHAWVEIFEAEGDVGYWVAIDPTNNTVVAKDHIKISHGRDYNDCMINHGMFTGGGSQQQNISAIVYRIEKNEISGEV